MNIYGHVRTIVRKFKNKVFVYIGAYQNNKEKMTLLKVGDIVAIEGGPLTGKTELLKTTVQKLKEQGANAIYLNSHLPLGDWVSEWKLFGKNLEAKTNKFLSNLPDEFYLIIDNAEKLQDSRKLELITALLEKARAVMIGCSRYESINPKIKARLEANTQFRAYHIGSSPVETVDATLYLLAGFVMVIVLMGAIELVLLIIALRLLFMGTRLNK